MAENRGNKNVKVEGEQKSVWGLLKKFLKWGVVVLVVVLALLVWVGNNTKEITKWVYDRQAQRYEEALQKHNDEMRARYTVDTDGGKTPEETIELFITALKAGDIEKASRYYVLEKQWEELGHLKEMFVKYGNLKKSVDFYTRIKEEGVKKCNEKMDGCTFEYVYTETATTTYKVTGMNQEIVVPSGEKTTEAIDVGLNHLSGVWKIELP
ncbi:MAG: hypothetical protein UY07_C0051G0005 [Parcubacteria group bacterium GW2011_GWA1_47_8]|nr:MAG: hypothetical protein UY07_C0051G0005 [Parcubacteria group bacterium GW2011_GWA1_47_8]